MQRHASFILAGLAFALLLPCGGFAAHNPADYPLRVHIFNHTGYSHYYGYNGARSLGDVDGEGRANLYENSQPRAFEFHYECEERLMNSEGYDTLPARWKKPNTELEVLLPVSGKTCKFHVAMKDGIAYHASNGSFGEGPAEKFKAWMDKYQYDPEHGKNLPIKPVEVAASSLNPANFPLRVHIFSHTGVSHYNAPSQSGPEVVDGEGRANLYENSEPRAFDFSYHCAARLLDSVGYDTYPARWKTQGRELEIMQPATDKTCVVNAAIKEKIAYTGDNIHIEEESAAAFRQWMDANQYDPEHGKEIPERPSAPSNNTAH
jgi:hypothetical protein